MAESKQKTLVLANFKYGLDTRRDALSSLAGTLAVAQNGHINSGGQFVKRKSFVTQTPAFPSFTRGLQDTDEGKVTFGGIPLTLEILTRERTTNVAKLKLDTAYNHTQFIAIGDTIVVSGVTGDTAYNGTQVVTAVNVNSFSYANSGSNEATTTSAGEILWSITAKLPPGVSYQVLLPPQGITGAVTTVLGSIPFSCNYLGKAYAIARFNSGTFCYYDGELVEQSRSGQVIRIETGNEGITDLSRDLAAQINDLANRYPDTAALWRAIANKNAVDASDQTGTSVDGSTLVMSPPGVYVIPTVSADSTAGVIGARLIDQDFDGTGSVAAKASFTLTGTAPGTVTVQVPTDADGSGLATLASAVSMTGTLHELAVAVVAAINATTYLYGYTAVASAAADITITAPISFGDVGTPFDATVVTTGSVSSTALVTPVLGPFAITMKYSTVVAQNVSSNGIIYAGNEALPHEVPTGAGVTYKWHEIDNPVNSGVVCDTQLDVEVTSPFFNLHQNAALQTGGTSTGGQVGDPLNRHHTKGFITGTFTTKWKCTATTSGGATSEVDFAMTFKR